MQKKKKVQNLASVDDPAKVKVLILAQQKTSFQDFFFIRNFSNVVKIDLSYNKLTSFPVGFSFKNFHHLKILFLHYNRFSAHKNLQCVCQSTTIQYLTLFGNTMEQAKTRHYFINKIPSLKLMDDKLIKVEERYPQLMFEQTNQKLLKVLFPIVTNMSNDLSSSFLAAVIEQLYIIRKRFLKVNPIIRIQRWFRKCIKQNRKKVSIHNSKIIEKSISENQIIKRGSQKLITQKLQNFKINQIKIISVLRMNFTFWNKIKELIKGNIYVLRNFCIQRQIKFQQIHSYYCLKKKQHNQFQKKRFLQFIIHSTNNYLIRKKGSNISMNLNKKLNLYKKLKTSKQEVYKLRPNTLLSQNLQKKRLFYENAFVRISKEQNQNIFHLIKDSYYKSIKSNDNFPFIFEEGWKRMNAAVSIQRMWKGYNVRKKVINFPNFLLRKTAAIKIQKWVRKLAFKNRNNFMLDSYYYIKQQNTNSITLKTSDLIKLKILMLQKLIGINFVFKQQKLMNIRYNSQGKNVCLGDKNLIHPPYFQNYIDFETYYDQTTEQRENSLILITMLVKGAINIKIDTKYTKFQYCSVLEARNRKYLLALGTYSFRTKQFMKSIEGYDITNQESLFQKIQKQPLISYNPVLNLYNRFEKQFKAKYYRNKEDLSKIIRISLPISYSVNVDFSSVQKILNSQKSLLDKKSYNSSAKISKNLLILQEKKRNFQQKRKKIDQLFYDSSIQDTENVTLRDMIRQSKTQNVRLDHESTIISQKKQKIEFIKNSHRERIQANNNLKNSYLKSLRKQINQEEQKQERSIKLTQIQTLMSNIKKHNLIRSKREKKDQDFEKKFLSRGNSSIKKQMIRHQKNSKSPDHNSIYSGNDASKHLLLSKPSKRYVNLKTQIKQFSLVISEADLSLGNLPMQQMVSKQKRKKRQRQIVSKKEEQYIRQQNVRFNSVQNFENKKKNQNQQKRKDRRKKIVHSVFPQEFYPLRQSKKIGFELPRIGK